MVLTAIYSLSFLHVAELTIEIFRVPPLSLTQGISDAYKMLYMIGNYLNINFDSDNF